MPCVYPLLQCAAGDGQPPIVTPLASEGYLCPTGQEFTTLEWELANWIIDNKVLCSPTMDWTLKTPKTFLSAICAQGTVLYGRAETWKFHRYRRSLPTHGLSVFVVQRNNDSRSKLDWVVGPTEGGGENIWRHLERRCHRSFETAATVSRRHGRQTIGRAH